MSPLLTPDQVAEQLGMSRRFVHDELRRGNLVGSRFGRNWRIDQVSVDAYVLAHRNVAPIERRTRRTRS